MNVINLDKKRKILTYRRIQASLRRVVKAQVRKIRPYLVLGSVFFSASFGCADSTFMNDPQYPTAVQKHAPQPADATDTTAHFNQMKANGRFLVNAENDSVIYLTNAQADSLNIGPVANVRDVSLARETGVPIGADKQCLKQAYGCTDNSDGYTCAYQFDAVNFKNLILFGLVQEESPQIRELCKSALRKGITLDHKNLQNFKSAFLNSRERIADGMSSCRALNEVFSMVAGNKKRMAALGLLNFSTTAQIKNLVKKMNAANPEAFKELQDRYVLEVYIPLWVSQKDRLEIAPEAFAALIGAEIHGHKSSNIKFAKEGNAAQLIRQEGNTSLMRSAGSNVIKNTGDNHRWLDLEYLEQCARAGLRVDINQIRQNVNKIVRQDLEQQNNKQIRMLNARSSLGR